MTLSADPADRLLRVAAPLSGPRYTVVPMEQAHTLVGRALVIVVDDRPDAPINAFQMREKSGQPVIAVTVPLIAYVQNEDEMAFILAHEAAHHIAYHLDRREESARAGALIFAQAAATIAAPIRMERKCFTIAPH